MQTNLLANLKNETAALTPSQRRVADYILKNPVEVTFFTLDKLSNTVGTSTTTIMRLCFRLGYNGFAEFQRDLQELLRDRVVPTTRLEVNKRNTNAADGLVKKSAKLQVDNINTAMEFLSEETLQSCAGLIKDAEKIYIVGTRSSFSIAYYLHHCLNQIFGKCALLKADNDDNVDLVLNMNASDLVIAVTLPRYAKATVDLVKVMHRYGPKIISITDGYNSPLAPLSDFVLLCPFRSLSFHNSIVGAVFLADVLIDTIALEKSTETKQRLEAAEDIYKQLNVHMGE